ncbi:MAG: pyruvate:ferredoxin (flavodoxin) oxidoreductase [Kordiimonadaceae bacterium]|jgi:pyruvate-ferredoxin/flavodoxin oxidoreductase|nr:pyruvate:ferredoxin (flavodoxin) oxidoreductase [Kordiimonadaceae bacterium]MBT6036639.1 pyruvate:ferredoxin (flavodoxin) oxidoreductase [Kordiimonadaceae bacterium]
MSNQPKIVAIDGNEAAVHIAYRVVDLCSIFPITPSSAMAEEADVWSNAKVKNIWGQVPDVIEMQSEGGAAGMAHGALQTGSLATTFTSSQGLLLMLPNMYKIAGELTATVFHVAARSLATQGLSIFGDHQDVMSARMTGFAMLNAACVQECHDMALITHAVTLRSRVPFMHFFDGFRTSHEIGKISIVPDSVIREMIDEELVHAHRNRGLNPDNPFIRGTAQNPDVYFQGRESANQFYDKVPDMVQETMDQFAQLTGRQYQLFDYYGAKDAERVIVIIGSGAETVSETVKELRASDESVGLLQVRLYRPFSVDHIAKVLPKTVKSIAVLDRTKEIGARGEPLYLDMVEALMSLYNKGDLPNMPKVIGGRYGLSSKEFTPAMVKAVFDELKKPKPKNHFTLGINDDVTHTSLDYDPSWDIEKEDVTRAIFYGLGSDGTVGANKNTIKIIGENTDLYAQGYFVYDSNKSGSQTISHLRFGPNPIKAPYLISSANFVACHKTTFVEKMDVLRFATDNATFLLNTETPADEVWDGLPEPIQQQIIDKNITLHVIDASKVAREVGMGRRINTIMQTCFFALSGVLPRDAAISQIKSAIEKSYSKKGEAVVAKNFEAVDAALDHLHEVEIPEAASSGVEFLPVVNIKAPDFVKQVTAPMMNGDGDDLPVSMLPVDGTYPTGTAAWGKRNVTDEIPIWEEDVCIQCGNCVFVCPHSAIRSKFYHQSYLDDAPETFKSAKVSARGFPEAKYTIQVYAEDCTGCHMCVEACPAFKWPEKITKAINMLPKGPVFEDEKVNLDFFDGLPINDRAEIDYSSVRGAQFLEPLFEFSGACPGCGETPYVKLLSQLFGPRLLVANATGCSSIYSGNLPTTPWTKNAEGRGPAWSNSLFEDNAEFGLGMRVSADKHLEIAKDLLDDMRGDIDNELVDDVINCEQQIGAEIEAQLDRVHTLKERLGTLLTPKAKDLLTVVDHLVRRSVWLVGGDGWAYDIGSAGLDHVLASGRNVNVLVMDTEVYSNTGGQMSKATPMAATAKFAAGGKTVGKKDIALQALSYGNVYVARIAMGANPQQTLQAFREAEQHKGPSLILAYSHCIAHGYDMRDGLTQQDLAVASGYWPLIRFNPELRQVGINPFVLDSPRPKIDFKEYAYNEMRYKNLEKSNPKVAAELMSMAQQSLNLKWDTYEKLAMQPASQFEPIF